MALARIKTWISGEVLTSSDLNAEFNNIITNAASLFSPLTAALDCDGFALRLDAAGVTELTSTAAIGLYLTTGAKSGTPGTAGSIANFTTHTFTDSATAGAGTATKYTGFSFPKPTLAAINSGVTTTDAATVYIEGPPTAGANETITNPMALWVDDGISRFDGPVNINGGLDVSNGAFSVSNGAFSVSNGAVNMFKAADIASAATVNLTTATGNLVHITGTTTITAVTLGSGMMRQVIFDGVLTLTHHATNNNLPGAENITTAAGDRALYWADGTTVYCVGYIRANGSVVVPAGATGAQVPQTQEVVGKTGAQIMQGPLELNAINTEVFANGGWATGNAGKGSLTWRGGDGAAIGRQWRWTLSDTNYFAVLRDETGGANRLLINGSDGETYAGAGAAFRVHHDGNTPKFESTELALASGTVAVSHGLGARPRNFWAVIRCVTAEFGYSIGHEVFLSEASGDNFSPGDSVGASVFASATSMGAAISDSGRIQVMNATSGIRQLITLANWKLVLRANP